MSDAEELSEGNDTPRSPSPVEPWTIEEARPEDADRLAAIQIDAFKSNDLFKVQFPTVKAFGGYRQFLKERIKEEIEHSRAHVLVIRGQRPESPLPLGPISRISWKEARAFAIWRPPYPNEDADLNASKQWPDETNVDMIVRWGDKVNEAYHTAMKDGICYRLDWLVTDKDYEGQGLGSLLLFWGLNLASSRGLPVYLESTMASERWYLNRGFKRASEMSIPLDHQDGEIYHEVGLLWEPYRSKFASVK